jgi:hypothetical protein
MSPAIISNKLAAAYPFPLLLNSGVKPIAAKGTAFQAVSIAKEERLLQSVLRIRTDLDRIRIRPLRTDRIRIHLSKMYLVVLKV